MNTSNVNGDKVLTASQQELVEQHICFAMNMGRKYRGMGVSVEDLQQDACLGMCEAALRYDPTKEVDFQTYAYNYCLKFVMAALRGQDKTPQLTDDGDVLAVTDVAEEDYFNGTALGEVEGAKVNKLLAVLDDKERKVVSMVYGINSVDPADSHEPMDFNQIAKKMSLPYLRVKQIYQSALAKMKNVG